MLFLFPAVKPWASLIASHLSIPICYVWGQEHAPHSLATRSKAGGHFGTWNSPV